jgi:hypothetical protein
MILLAEFSSEGGNSLELRVELRRSLTKGWKFRTPSGAKLRKEVEL